MVTLTAFRSTTSWRPMAYTSSISSSFLTPFLLSPTALLVVLPLSCSLRLFSVNPALGARSSLGHNHSCSHRCVPTGGSGRVGTAAALLSCQKSHVNSFSMLKRIDNTCTVPHCFGGRNILRDVAQSQTIWTPPVAMIGSLLFVLFTAKEKF